MKGKYFLLLVIVFILGLTGFYVSSGGNIKNLLSTAGSKSNDDNVDLGELQNFNAVCNENVSFYKNVLRDSVVEKRSLYLCRFSYMLQYDPKINMPLWVLETLNIKNMVSFNLPDFSLTYDPNLPKIYQINPEFYNHTNEYVPWHVASILDMYKSNPALSNENLEKLNEISFSQGFYTTNTIPVTKFAKKILDQIDSRVPMAVQRSHMLWVVSGPLFFNGNNNGVYSVDNKKVFIPTHLFKFIYDFPKNKYIIFIVPNVNNDLCGDHCNIEDYISTYRILTTYSGIDFFSSESPEKKNMFINGGQLPF